MKNNNLLLIGLLSMTVLILISGVGCKSVVSPLGNTKGAEFTIEVRDYAFKPDQLVIKTGDTVTWVNVGEKTHAAISDNGTEIASQEILSGASFSHVFNMPGTYTYHCPYFSFMKATIIVQ